MSAVAWFFSQWWGILITVIVALLLVIVLYRPFFKRFFDILLSGVALILLSPVFLVLTLLVRKKLGSPVMFRQMRPGKHEKIFRLHKYRTMTEQRDENGNLLSDEIRLTRFGKFLRATSLDELPEIWDIFRGKMSIIGPRPLLVDYLPRYNERQHMRHNVRPGLTGLAQVMGRNSLSWEQKFEYDVTYVEHFTVFTDIKIFFLTIFKVFKREGISQAGEATMEVFQGNARAEKNVLILSCGRRVELVKAFLAARDRLGLKGKVVCADCCDTAPALQFGDAAALLPPVSDEGYIQALAALIQKESIHLVVPTIDTELQALADNRAVLQQSGARVLISGSETVAICGDKEKTAAFFARNGFAAPKTYSAEEIAAEAETYPLFVKPRNGSSSINAFRVKNRTELDFFTRYVDGALVQECIGGAEYTIDCLADFDGNPLLIVPRRRLAVRGGEILKGRTEKNAELIAQTKALVTALGAIGQITVQGFLGNDGMLRFIEINARFGGGAPMSIKAGADFCEALYRLLLGETLDYREDWTDGALLARFDDSVVIAHD